MDLIKGIPINNLYLMLAYAMEKPEIDEEGFGSSEYADSFLDLVSDLLLSCVSDQVVRGLHCDYTYRKMTSSRVRGKIVMNDTAKLQSKLKSQVVCSTSVYSSDNVYNRIVKSTLERILLHSIVQDNIKKRIRGMLRHFDGISPVDLDSIRWGDLVIWSGNLNYVCILNICRLVVEDLLPSDSDGNLRMKKPVIPTDDKMSSIFEKFIKEYYKRHFKGDTLGSNRISWGCYDDYLLPRMQTDVYMRRGNRILIIDAKFYREMLQLNYGTEKQRSENLYQILSYVMNESFNRDGFDVSGVVLYARSSGTLPDYDYNICGRRISFRSLDLSLSFREIASFLDSIVSEGLDVR